MHTKDLFPTCCLILPAFFFTTQPKAIIPTLYFPNILPWFDNLWFKLGASFCLVYLTCRHEWRVPRWLGGHNGGGSRAGAVNRSSCRCHWHCQQWGGWWALTTCRHHQQCWRLLFVRGAPLCSGSAYTPMCTPYASTLHIGELLMKAAKKADLLSV